MGSVGDESHVAVAETTVELSAEPRLQEAEGHENASMEVTEEPRPQEAKVPEDALVEEIKEPRLQEAEGHENASVEVTEEPRLREIEVPEDTLVEEIKEPRLQEAEGHENASVEVTEEPRLREIEVPEDALVEEIKEPHLQEAEDTSVDVVEKRFSALMGPGMETENVSVTTGEPEVKEMDAAVQQVVPAPKRNRPSVKRFSARKSAGVESSDTMDYGSVANGGGVPNSTAPSAIRRQRVTHKFSARLGMGIDDRDTVDYGLVTDDPPKPVETDAVVEEAVPSTTGSKEKVLSYAEREQLRLQFIKRNKEIVCFERVKGKLVNITEGLELHTGVFSRVEQQKLVAFVRELQAKGKRNELKEKTYNEPNRWKRGKGRVTIQFGCCYNYAERDGIPPGILRDEVVDAIPLLLRKAIKRLVTWHVLPPTCVPDSCIINIYKEGDCIPPHVDSNDFLRPFCTLSLLSECSIAFGSKDNNSLKPVQNLDGEFRGTFSLPLPVGSVLVLKGNGADKAKHAIPSVSTERISITFRKMDPAKVPTGFVVDRELQNLRPVTLPS